MANVIYNPEMGLVHNPIVFGKENVNDIVGLDPTYLILEKVLITPDYDPETEAVTESWTVDLPNLQYVQTWTIVAKPIAQDWENFNIAILTNNYWANWGIMADLRTSIISASVSRLPEQLQTAYDLAKSLTPPSAEAINDWKSIADMYHIPIVF